jgi:hypothetical protein
MKIAQLIERNMSQDSRQKIYLILVSMSLLFLFYSLWQVKWVITDISAPLGLAAYYASCYWVGLALLLLTAIFAFLDHELKKDATFIIILITLGLFLLGIRVFIEANALDPDSYYPTSEVKNLLEASHLALNNPPHIVSYYSWPAIHFISASLLETTGANLLPIIKYTPLFWIVFLVFVVYGIGKRLQMESNQCFLLSFLTISSWQHGLAGFYHARAPAMILFLLLFMLLIMPRKTVADTITIVLLFTALAFTHGLTSVAIILGILLLAVYRRELRFVVLFLIIFGAWYIFQAYLVLGIGLQACMQPLKDILSLLQMERYGVEAPSARLASRYADLGLLAIYAVLMVLIVIMLLRRRITGRRREKAITIFCWIIGVAFILFWGHGQAAYRAFCYCLVPMACIIAVSLSNRKLLIPLMCLLVLLSPVVNYATVGINGQVWNTELKGADFFSLTVKPQDSYFYGYSNQLLLFYNPALVRLPAYLSSRKPVLSEVNISVMDEVKYILFSKLGSNRALGAWGKDPYGAWLKSASGRRSINIYNNGSFQIYINYSSN